MTRTIKPTADAVALASMFARATEQYDSTPTTEKSLRGALSAKRLGFALQLAEELTPQLIAEVSTPRIVEIERVDPRETAAHMEAGAAHSNVGVMPAKGATP